MSRESSFNHQVEQAVADFEIWCEENGSSDLESFLESSGLTESVACEVRKYFEQEKQIMGMVEAETPGIHGFSITNPMPAILGDAESVPEKIGRYRVERVLGKGGFGIVYLAHDDRLERLVAIKVPYARLVSRFSEAEAYLIEARTVAHLDQTHIVPVYDVGQTDDFPCFIVSKYVEGIDLAAKLKQTRLSVRESAELVATVADALHHAHKQGFVHRDVKPGNILLGDDGKAYVVDFGLALKEQDIDNYAKYAGTPAYMSPEQARGEGHRVDGRSDIYSLGTVLFELLVGHRPFTGQNQLQLLDQITSQEVKPPRQIDDTIPKEMERICLRSLAKRASDRYTTASDMADDLRHFLAQQPTVSISANERAQTSKKTGSELTESGIDSVTPTSDSESLSVKVVPKGLRSFDSHDSEFFLELLPGPRDRNGLPDNIRFWKNRIEDDDPDHTFRVGLIYGPSGCGKSSFVKAGLLPQLSVDVVSVYIEATVEETESRLLHRLRRRFPRLDQHLNLTTAFAELRRNRRIADGKKLLIVLDQFEQWLHGKPDEMNCELVQALRHCDGENVQCVLLVRDDFWMATTRLMHELEIRLIEGQNAAAIDLFPMQHARRVLAAFGQAFGVLPRDTQKLEHDQKTFVDESIKGLADNGKVICVRLALFVEMIKGKTWVPSTLVEIGGTEGVGATFLEETFSSPTAPPENRYHQKAARAVLQALLPQSGIGLKGDMKSSEELLLASGYSDQAEKFDDLVRILDTQLRLIAPTTPEGIEDIESSSPVQSESPREENLTAESHPSRFYQLTHDYLVPSLRAWLTRKQRETRRGRAELRLAERSDLWNAKPENRHLPSWWEFGGIHLLTDHRKWTSPQAMMMSKAKKIIGLRLTLTMFAILAVAIVMIIYQSVLHDRFLQDQVRTAVAAMSTSREILVPRAIDDLIELPQDLVLEELKTQFASADEIRKLPLAYALARFGDLRIDFLLEQIEDISPRESNNMNAALAHDREPSLAALKRLASKLEDDMSQLGTDSFASDQRNKLPLNRDRLFALHTEREKGLRFKARLSMVALQLDSPSLAQKMCQFSSDPLDRTVFIDESSTWHGSLADLLERIEEYEDSAFRSAIAMVVGSIPSDEIFQITETRWPEIFAEWYLTDTDRSVHSAVGFALRKWQVVEPQLKRSEAPTGEFEWHINGINSTMLRISPGSFVREVQIDGEQRMQKVTLTKSFLLSDREITTAQFRRFVNDPDYSDEEKPISWPGVDSNFNKSDRHPVQNINWFDAILFCNWLSNKEGLRPCYERTGEQRIFGDTLCDTWKLASDGNGYRLPTEAEWEYACRAGTKTKYCCGDFPTLLSRYAVHTSSETEIPGNRLPNDWGLFDLPGNVNEWCQDWFGSYEDGQAIQDPMGPVTGKTRLLRGGAFNLVALHAESSDRSMKFYPVNRYYNDGFRVARTYP